MKEIKLSQGKFTIVDDQDFEYLSQWKWYTFKGLNTFYAARNIPFNGKQKQLPMHRVIMELNDSQRYIDHIDHNGLNNTRGNLRICSTSQNAMNRRSARGCSSQYKGVSFNKRAGKFVAYITVNGKILYLGYYIDEAEAAGAYDQAAKEHYKEFANLNFK